MIDSTTWRSPNYDRRTRPISCLVIHATVGWLGGSLAWLCNPTSKVSAHYVISKRGQVYQLVNDSNVAWHAGRAVWRGEAMINAVSLGVELENTNDGHDPYPASQIDALLLLARQKCMQYGIARGWVVRHVDIAPGRKTDPAGFPWAEFLTQLYRPRVARVDLPIYQEQDVDGTVAGLLHAGEGADIDCYYPNGAAHLADGRGFVRVEGLI